MLLQGLVPLLDLIGTYIAWAWTWTINYDVGELILFLCLRVRLCDLTDYLLMKVMAFH